MRKTTGNSGIFRNFRSDLKDSSIALIFNRHHFCSKNRQRCYQIDKWLKETRFSREKVVFFHFKHSLL